MSYYRPTYPSTFTQQMQQMQLPMQQPQMPLPMQPPQLPQMQPQPNGYNGYICRPVTGEEEARAVPTDFSGATLVLIDAAHETIYTKALNPADGTALFSAYRLSPMQPQAQQYAQAQDVEQLRKELESIKAILSKKPTGKGGNAE